MPTRVPVPATLGKACIAEAEAVIAALRAATSPDDLLALIEAVTRDLHFRHFALVDHSDLRVPDHGLVDLKRYPPAIADRLIAQGHYRRDPVIRGCVFADGAFVWSDLDRIIRLDRRDRDSFALGAREGLNEGITVPYVRLGTPTGSCTFAGTRRPDKARRYLGVAQMVGIFGFQAARRLVRPAAVVATPPRLHPRPRDCVILAGRGLSNKEIARALALTPRTVDGYLTEARQLFDAHDRTELVIGALLAGEIGLHELAPRQPG